MEYIKIFGIICCTKKRKLEDYLTLNTFLKINFTNSINQNDVDHDDSNLYMLRNGFMHKICKKIIG
jgi:hypothetical protein